MTDPKDPAVDPDGESEPDAFELHMAEALGQESTLDPDELELLIAAGEEAGDLDEGEFEGLSGLARALDSAGALDEVALATVTEEEKKEAARAWAALVHGNSSGEPPHGDSGGGLRALAPVHERSVKASTNAPTSWWRHPKVRAFAFVALMFAAFLGGQYIGPKNTDTPPGPTIPDGTLGSDPNAPELTPTLARADDGTWTVALEDVQGEARAALRDLALELEIKDASGAWTSRPEPRGQFSPGNVRWDLTRVEASAPDGIRFRIRRDAPAGRPGWRTDWFLGNQVSSKE